MIRWALSGKIRARNQLEDNLCKDPAIGCAHEGCQKGVNGVL